MSRGLKIWLWVTMILYGASALTHAFTGNLLFFLAAAAYTIAIAVMLFKRKRVAYMALWEIGIFSMVLEYMAGNGLVMAVFSAVLYPLVTYLFLRRDWGGMD